MAKSKIPGVKHHAIKQVPHYEKGGTVKPVQTLLTPDGGQQYLREGYKSTDKVGRKVSDPGSFTDKSRRTVDPRAAKLVNKAEAYALGFDRKGADKYADRAEAGAERQNAITRKFGDRTRR